MTCLLASKLPMGATQLLCAQTGLIANIAASLFLIAAFASIAFSLWILPRKAAFALPGSVSALGLLTLSLASNGPALQTQQPNAQQGLVVALIDTSQSMTRAKTSFEAARQQMSEQLQKSLEQSDQSVVDNWLGQVVEFDRALHQRTSAIALSTLPIALRSNTYNTTGSASALSDGLERAIDLIQTADGRGAIWLLSDGNFTGKSPLAAAQRAARAGIPVHIFAHGTDVPGTGLISSNIGPEQFVGKPTTTRLTLLGDGQLRWSENGQSSDSSNEIAFSNDVPTGARLTNTFDARGLQFIEIRMPDTTDAPRHLYTLVRGPIRALVYGPSPWIDALSTSDVLVTRADPKQATDLTAFDVVIIDSLSPERFRADFVTDMANAATIGTGLFVINGPLRGSIEDPQLISDWEETDLGGFLPTNSNPEDYITQTPDRDILIVIDTSGSMDGSSLKVAKETGSRIIDQLRLQDTIAIIPFSGIAGQGFAQRKGTSFNKEQAMDYLNALEATGGTNFDAAIAAANTLKGNNCALFFLSDAGDNAPATRLRCQTTLIGVAGNTYAGGIDAFGHGQEITIAPGDSIKEITFNVFNPEERTRLWKEGAFQPIPDTNAERFVAQVTVNGLALSYIRPGTQLALFHDKPPYEPLLAFRTDPDQRLVTTGVYLSDMDAYWTTHPAQTRAILQRLSGWEDQYRFDIRISFEGDQMILNLTSLGEEPAVSIGASLRLADGTSQSIALKSTGFAGEFHSRFRPTLQAEPSRGNLVLEEPDRQTQIIPMRLPARLDVAAQKPTFNEKISFGINRALLNTLKQTSRGMDLSSQIPKMTQNTNNPEARDIWRWCAVLGAMMIAAALYLGGHRT